MKTKLLLQYYKKWLSISSSTSYFQFILQQLALKKIQNKIDEFNELKNKCLLMLHYDVWQDAGCFQSHWKT
jgi:hypothetical protein